MAKFYGKIIFVNHTETSPGIWKEVQTKRYYYGELIQPRQRFFTNNKTNEDVDITNKLSILYDLFAIENLSSIAAVEIAGSLWKVTDIQISYPRLILSVGGIYNGKPTATT